MTARAQIPSQAPATCSGPKSHIEPPRGAGSFHAAVTDKTLLVAIVDDDESVRRALARLVQSARMEAVTFACGEQFLSEVERLEPDCVVLDLHMPGTSGFDVQARLQQSSKAPPVVAITGCDTLEAAARILGSGASAYLLKPVEKETFLEAIARAVGARK